MDHLGDQLAGMSALSEPARRRLYEYVARQSAPVSREQAAEGVSLPVHSVKFHLDKLVDAGLLEVEYRRLTGRTGPGAGRPSKLYRRSAKELEVSLPPRSYDLAGALLATAVERAAGGDVPIGDAVREVAREEGRRIARGVDVLRAPGGTPGGTPGHARSEDLGRVASVLADQGYEPQVSEAAMCLRNCPFDRLAAEHTELVCGMNLSLVDGVLDGLRISSLTARLAPAPGLCCVKVEPSRSGV